MNLNTLKMWYGYLLLLILGTLIAMVSLGHVNKETSYGLDGLITGLLMLIQQWASWAFNRRNDKTQKPTQLPQGDAGTSEDH